MKKHLLAAACLSLMAFCAQAQNAPQSPVEPGFVMPVGPAMLIATDRDNILWTRSGESGAAWKRVDLAPDARPYILNLMRCADNNGGMCVVQFTAGGEKETRLLVINEKMTQILPLKGDDQKTWAVEAVPDAGHIYFTRPAGDGSAKTLMLYSVFDQNYARIDRITEVGTLAAGERLLLTHIDTTPATLAAQDDGTLRDITKTGTFRWHLSDDAVVSDWGILDAEPWATDQPVIADMRTLKLIRFEAEAENKVAVKAAAVAALPVSGEIPVPLSLTIDGLNDVLALTVGPASNSISLLCKAESGQYQFKPLIRLESGATPTIAGSRSGMGFVISTPSFDRSPQFELIRLSTKTFGWAKRSCADAGFSRTDAGIPVASHADRFSSSGHKARSMDGTTVPYDVVSPKGIAPDNAIIHVYGAYGVQKPRAFFREKTADYLLGNRTASVFPIVRGDGNLGLAYALASRTPDRANAVNDVIAVAEDLVRTYPSLRGRITLKGSSAGAWLSVKAALARPDLFSGVIASAGPYLFEGAPYAEGGAKFFAAEDELTSDLPKLKTVCPKLKFRFIHAKDDARVDYGQAKRFAGLVEAAGCPVEFVSHEQGGHFILIPAGGAMSHDEALRTNFAPF